MNDALQRLLSIASGPILSPPTVGERKRLKSMGKQGKDLLEMLSLRNGWYAFESALHVFPLGKGDDILDLESWNSSFLWRNEFGSLAQGCFFFSQDVFGVQFCFKAGGVHVFDPETGDTNPFAESLQTWAEKILAEYHLHTGYPLARDWQKQNRPLRPGERLFPKIPFVLQGSYTVDNLYAMEATKGMKFMASIASQIRTLPDGSRVRLVVKK